MTPCPKCGSLARAVAGQAALTATADLSATASVDRGLNDIRLALLGILVTIGLTVGFGVSASAPIRFGAGAGSFIGTAALIWWPPSKRRLMTFMHWLTGR